MSPTAWPFDSAGDPITPIAGGLGLTEAPVYDRHRDRVLFSDVTRGGVWAYDWDGSLEPVLTGRRGIGGLALDQRGSVIVGGKNVIAIDPVSISEQVVCQIDDLGQPLIGFNDMCADPEGRLYVGGLGYVPLRQPTGPAGAVVVLEPDGDVQTAFAPVGLPNGMACDRKRGLLYVCDSSAGTILVFSHNAVTGALALDSTLNLESDRGQPDGIAIAQDGSLWVATAEGRTVDVISTRGIRLASFRFPGPLVTNLCFAGPASDILVVTGGALGSEASDASVWAMRTQVTGSAVEQSQLSRVVAG